MESGAHQKPKRLAAKLKAIRTSLNLSQGDMVKRLGLDVDGQMKRERISAFEKEGEDNRVPPLWVLLRYAEAAGVWVDVLIDDGLDLPKELPATERARLTYK